MIVLRQRGVVDEFRGGMVFQRSSLAYDQRGRLYGLNQARFETIAGRRGIRIEEGTMNLISNPSFGADSNSDGVADGWSFVSYGATASLVSDALFGTKSQRITSTAGDTFAARRIERTIPITGGATYVFSGYLKTDGVARGQLRIDTNGTNPLVIELTPESPTTWRRQSIVFTAPADATQVIVRCYNSAPQGVVGWVQWNGVQLEQKPYATSFVDGTRAAESITIPTAGVLNQQQGTISCWFYYKPCNVYQRLVSLVSCDGAFHINDYYDIHLDISPSGYVRFQPLRQVGGSSIYVLSSNKIQEGWHFVSCTWSSSGIELIVDEQNPVTNAYGGGIAALDTILGIGRDVRSNSQPGYLNGLVADLHISSIARSYEEILADFQRGYHVPDQYTTFYHPLDGPDSQRAARSVVL